MTVVGFPSACAVPSVIGMTRMTSTAAFGAAALAMALTLTGCSAGSAADEAAPSQNGNGSDGGAATDVEEGGAQSAADDDTAGRAVITSGYVTLTADDPLTAADDVVRLVERAGGRIDARQEYAPADDGDTVDAGSATLTVRIPTADLTPTLDAITALGTADEVSLTSEDVTTESQDLDARIAALDASIDRLTVLLRSASRTADLIELEGAISERQAELEGLEARRRGLDDQISLSTVQIELRSEATAATVSAAPGDFLGGLAVGWASLVSFVSGLLVVLGVLLPWLAVGAVIAIGVVLLVRRLTRRHAAAAPATAAVE